MIKQRILNVKRRLPPREWITHVKALYYPKYETPEAHRRLRNVYNVQATHIDVLTDLEDTADYLTKTRQEVRKQRLADYMERSRAKRAARKDSRKTITTDETAS